MHRASVGVQYYSSSEQSLVVHLVTCTSSSEQINVPDAADEVNPYTGGFRRVLALRLTQLCWPPYKSVHVER